MKRKLAANRVNLHVTAAIAAVVGTLSIPAPASAVTAQVFTMTASSTPAAVALRRIASDSYVFSRQPNVTTSTLMIHSPW